jgi:hypothetical protein
MKPGLYIAIATVMLGVAVGGRGASTPKAAQGPAAGTTQAVFRNYQDLKWEKILPDLGGNSPEICILSVDPKTQATKLMIRAPKAIHVVKHWHSVNEAHAVILGNQVFTCEGKRSSRGPELV